LGGNEQGNRPCLRQRLGAAHALQPRKARRARPGR
jgi:hypothetical protein